MKTLGCEELYIRNVENSIRGIRLGSKKPEDVAVTVSASFNKLKTVNIGMFEELMEKYDNVVRDYRNRIKK
jgi:hypothetical protein